MVDNRKFRRRFKGTDAARQPEDEMEPIAPLESRSQRLARREAEEAAEAARQEAERQRAEAEAKAAAEAERAAQARAKADAKARAQAEAARRAAEAEAARRAEEERQEQERAAEAARLEALRRARARAKAAQREAEERRLAEEAQREAEEQARLRAEAEAEARAEAERAHQEALARKARQEAEKRKRAADAKAEAEEKARAERAAQEAAEAKRRAREERARAIAAQREKAARKAEAERLAEEERQAEVARLAEEKRKAEAERIAEEERKAEAERLAEEERKAEAARLAEEKRRAGEARQQAVKAAKATQATAAPTLRPPQPAHDPWEDLATFNVDERVLTRNRIITATRDDPAHSAFDVLRTRLLQALNDNGWKRVAITSPGKDCGKTFTAANLAISLSRQENCRTLLMDCDMRRPSLHKIMGVENPGAMGDLLRGNVDPGDHLLRMGSNRIHAGRNIAFGFNNLAEPYASELLQDPSTAETLDLIQDRYKPDVMLFDLPPALFYDDVIAFRPLFDGVLLVIGGGLTTEKEVKEVERRLGDQTPLLGIVLNKAEGTEMERYRY